MAAGAGHLSPPCAWMPPQPNTNGPPEVPAVHTCGPVSAGVSSVVISGARSIALVGYISIQPGRQLFIACHGPHCQDAEGLVRWRRGGASHACRLQPPPTAAHAKSAQLPLALLVVDDIGGVGLHAAGKHSCLSVHDHMSSRLPP